MFAVFDEVWSDGLARGHDIALERNRLASIILELARDRQLGPAQISRSARRLNAATTLWCDAKEFTSCPHAVILVGPEKTVAADIAQPRALAA